MDASKLLVYSSVLFFGFLFLRFYSNSLFKEADAFKKTFASRILFYLIGIHQIPTIIFCFALVYFFNVDIEFAIAIYLTVAIVSAFSLFKNQDIYKKLRPKDDLHNYLGLRFPSIDKIPYADALIYPRFILCYGNKPVSEAGIFETSDYKMIMQLIGNRVLSVGSKISYNEVDYEIKNLSIDILDIVIDYSNGHSDYYLGKGIPFHIEIRILV